MALYNYIFMAWPLIYNCNTNITAFNFRKTVHFCKMQGAYSQHLIFFVTYELVQ